MINNTNTSTSKEFQARASFNTHQSKKSLSTATTTTTTTTPQSTVEYASFNIKPSQYKQTGIFLPINNSTPKSLVHLIKEELELIIQALRNVQKQRAQSPPLEQFVRSLDDFVDKYQPQLGALIPAATNELAESQQARFRSLSGAIKTAAAATLNNSDDLESALSHLSRLLNEFMQNLDKLNSFYIQQSLIMK